MALVSVSEGGGEGREGGGGGGQGEGEGGWRRLRSRRWRKGKIREERGIRMSSYHANSFFP